MDRVKFTKISCEYNEKSKSMEYSEDGWVSIPREDLEKAIIENWGNRGYKITISNPRRVFEVKENPLEEKEVR